YSGREIHGLKINPVVNREDTACGYIRSFSGGTNDASSELVRNPSRGAPDWACRTEHWRRLSRVDLRGIDQRTPSRDIGDADPRRLFKTQVPWQREHGGGRDGEILRVTAVTAETEVTARTEHRLTQKLVRPFHD